MDNEAENILNFKKIKLIVGLGNIGREYFNTRHNAGFEFVEFLSGTHKFLEEKKLKSLLVRSEINQTSILFCKPTTLMNSSGEAVRLVSDYYSINPEEILIAHDDLDLGIGNYKIQFGKGPKIHNGILSIESRLGTSKFWRTRIGVENRDGEQRKFFAGADYVLSRLKTEEQKALMEVFEKIRDKMTQTAVEE